MLLKADLQEMGRRNACSSMKPLISPKYRNVAELPEPSFSARMLFGFYKSVLSPALHAFSPTQCKYLPTCSEYSYVAFARFGAVRGTWLSLRRFARCHPFAEGGLDPVPDAALKSAPIPPKASEPDHLS